MYSHSLMIKGGGGGGGGGGKGGEGDNEIRCWADHSLMPRPDIHVYYLCPNQNVLKDTMWHHVYKVV